MRTENPSLSLCLVNYQLSEERSGRPTFCWQPSSALGKTVSAGSNTRHSNIHNTRRLLHDKNTTTWSHSVNHLLLHLTSSLSLLRVVFADFFVMNLILWGEGSSAAMPFGTLVAILALWFCISVPLTFIGAYFGFKKAVSKWQNLHPFIRNTFCICWYTFHASGGLQKECAAVTMSSVKYSKCSNNKITLQQY